MGKTATDSANGKTDIDEEKPKERKVTIKADKISRYFTEDYSSEDIENIIYQLLEEWNTGKATNKQ